MRPLRREPEKERREPSLSALDREFIQSRVRQMFRKREALDAAASEELCRQLALAEAPLAQSLVAENAIERAAGLCCEERWYQMQE